MAPDFRTTTIGELIASDGGSVKTGPFGTVLKAAEYSSVGVPLISVGEVGYGEFRVDARTPRVSPAVTTRLPDYVLRVGDIVFGRKGAVDRSARIREAQDGWFLGSDGIRLRLPATVDSTFVALQLQSRVTRAWILQHATGTTMASLNQGIIERIPVVLPSLAEQRGIAQLLGALDKKYDLNARTSETLEAMARALFRSWFVDFDPVRAKAEGGAPAGMKPATAALFPDGFEKSDLGDIPRGWEPTTLKDLTSKIGSGATPTGGDRNYVEDGVAFIRSQNVYDSTFVWGGLARIDDSAAEQLRGVTVQRDDVLLNITGASILRTCLVVPSVLPARVNQHVAIVRARDGVPASFLHLHLLEPSTKSYLLGMDAGGSRQAVTKAHIESVPVVLPSASVLALFREVIEPLLSGKNNCLDESQTLVELRDALLPKLLSGELRVRYAEKAVEQVA